MRCIPMTLRLSDHGISVHSITVAAQRGHQVPRTRWLTRPTHLVEIQQETELSRGCQPDCFYDERIGQNCAPYQHNQQKISLSKTGLVLEEYFRVMLAQKINTNPSEIKEHRYRKNVESHLKKDGINFGKETCIAADSQSIGRVWAKKTVQGRG